MQMTQHSALLPFSSLLPSLAHIEWYSNHRLLALNRCIVRLLASSTNSLTLALAGSFAPYLSIILGRRHALRGAVITVMPARSSVLAFSLAWASPSQTTPPQSRHPSLYAGNIDFGTFKMNNAWSWRIPSILQGWPSVSQVYLGWFMPESPRWLISKGRDAQILHLSAYYYMDYNDNDPRNQHQKSAECRSSRRRATGRMRITILLLLFSHWSGSGHFTYCLNEALLAKLERRSLFHIRTGVSIFFLTQTICIQQCQTHQTDAVVFLFHVASNAFNFVISLASSHDPAHRQQHPGHLTPLRALLASSLVTLRQARAASGGASSSLRAARGCPSSSSRRRFASGSTRRVRVQTDATALIFLLYAAYDLAFTPPIVSGKIQPHHPAQRGSTPHFVISLALIFDQYVDPIAPYLAFEGVSIYFDALETKNLSLEETAAHFDCDDAVERLEPVAHLAEGKNIGTHEMHEDINEGG
ncbi:hypothetical protein FIBSPDRAFT_1037111 [Athelia psychrophila]|uniref:Major facilitator superfamily (MFS) profile domain-containing protein n=1 Tax=Athelia psychrophila TaxID=1759441 RepID=A0A166USS4_9AGAM|nr:hypothetical protein FIBSPDRAFT_1037111 [Fibularhizoctonia sp. CBS 109695]